ncbi:transcriptional regulator, ArsR family [Brachyspira intermedia PWS/A]|uniref:Transcriptional regulator, ArsR family n=1 Tax=Brachyspira intermedia (strain ATCC 51140 / PWS/A) TaxID=1045858 RepID=G0EN73_BRAIP|nr:metalloregulator ArsR/SmtB family transcription factor [Brachyspira intermedia]AEM23033.1 transcriptional regulator, ArsR family [Brachyspira intermedia PWS/A]
MKDYKKEAIIFKAFCDENRLQILDMIKNDEICACKLLEELKIVQSTLSHHMKILCDAEVVIPRKEGKWTYYSINKEGFERAKELLNYYIKL